MTVAYAARTPWIGSRLHREEEPRYAWERPLLPHGAEIPGTLTVIEELADWPRPAKKTPVPKPKLRKCQARKSRATAPKIRPNLYPCPDCGGRSKGKGSASGGGYWRQCQDCKRNFRTTPAPVRTPWPPCPRPNCGGRAVSNGKTPAGRRILLCRSCKKSFRIDEPAGEGRQER